MNPDKGCLSKALWQTARELIGKKAVKNPVYLTAEEGRRAGGTHYSHTSRV
jgi:hypothetical protein